MYLRAFEQIPRESHGIDSYTYTITCGYPLSIKRDRLCIVSFIGLHLIPGITASSISGLMVKCPLAMRTLRVRFPADALFPFFVEITKYKL
jgi:hypothetical protein